MLAINNELFIFNFDYIRHEYTGSLNTGTAKLTTGL